MQYPTNKLHKGILHSVQPDGTQDGWASVGQVICNAHHLFCGIFDIGKKQKAEDEQRLRNEKHVADWILVVSSLLTWYQGMKQPTISKRQVRGAHAAVQWLMRFIATVAPRIGGMTNNTIKRHLVLHLCEDILDHGVPDNVNSAYAESAHITLAKASTSQDTQK